MAAKKTPREKLIQDIKLNVIKIIDCIKVDDLMRSETRMTWSELKELNDSLVYVRNVLMRKAQKAEGGGGEG